MRRNDSIPSILQRIVAAKREELLWRVAEVPLVELRRRVERQPPGRSLARALRDGPPGAPHSRVRLIAEVKMASPSAGPLVDDARRISLPRLYAENGAAAVSVLTERDHFAGDLQHLVEAKEMLEARFCESAPPVLRKDFLFEPYQVWESKAAGADAILLIAALMSTGELVWLLSLAQEMGMECLIEAHDRREVERALEAGAGIIGINNRDLRTFDVDLATTQRLRMLIPDDRIVVAESGIQTRADVECMADCGVHAVLVGEALIRATDLAEKMRELTL